MQNLLIVGAGAFAREVYEHAHASIGYGTDFQIKGFLEGNIPLRPEAYGLVPMPVIASITDYEIQEDDVFIIALSDTSVKEAIAGIIDAKGGKYMNLIHKTAIVSPRAQLGKDIIICQNTTISCDCRIGDHVMVNVCSEVGHDVEIGNFTSIMCYVDITGYVKIGTHTFWGSGSRAIPHSVIGDHVTVGAGSVILKSAHAGRTYFGVPARPVLKI